MGSGKPESALGRLAPSYVTMDVVVPLGQLPGLVREIQVIKERHGVEVATAFHAGDGNLHPGVHYDDRNPDESRRAHRAADEIIRAALDRAAELGEIGPAAVEHRVEMLVAFMMSLGVVARGGAPKAELDGQLAAMRGLVDSWRLDS